MSGSRCGVVAMGMALSLLPAVAGAAGTELIALAYSAASNRAAIVVAGPDSASAATAARSQCGERCQVLVVAPAGICVAFAREPRVVYGWAMSEADDEAKARADAVAACRRGGPARACPILASRCLPAVHAPAHYGSPRPVTLADPARTIVVIHSHGSGPPAEADPCHMDRINAPYGVPAVMHALEGMTIAGRRVVVDGFCTPTRRGTVDAATGEYGKLLPRARDIGERAAAYIAAGVPPRQIILSGQSAGGWASLIAARDHPEAIGAVIAFAPAGWGRAASRSPALEGLRRRHYTEMLAAPRLRALVFAFDGDEFEPPGDLRALAAIPGAEVVTIPQPGPAGRRCAFIPHGRVRDPCFSEIQSGRIRAFIAAQTAEDESR